MKIHLVEAVIFITNRWINRLVEKGQSWPGKLSLFSIAFGTYLQRNIQCYAISYRNIQNGWNNAQYQVHLIVPDWRLCRITDISVCHEQTKYVELIYILCKFLSNYFTNISSCFIYLVFSQRLNKESCFSWYRNCNAACLPLKEPAMITNRTTPTLIIVKRLFTVDDSFTPSASATEMHRIIRNF